MSLDKTYNKLKSKNARLNEELEMINRLGLTKEQKNALFQAAGESMKKLDAADLSAIMQTCCPECVVDGDLNKTVKKVVAEASIDEMVSVLESMIALTEDEDELASLDEMVLALTEAADDDSDDKDESDDEDDKDDEKAQVDAMNKKMKMDESLKAIFGSDLLTEETQDKVVALFEAAIAEKVHANTVEIEQRLEEEMALQIEQLVNTLDVYLEEAANEFIAKNQIELEQGIRVEMMEQFMGGIKSLVESHNFAIETEQVELVESLAAKVEQLEATLDESLNEKASLKLQIEEGDKAAALAQVGKALTLSQQEKLATLAEDLEFTTKEKYAKKLEVIVEQYFTESKAKVSDAVEGVLTEEKEVDSSVNAYAKTISRTLKK